jgi:hypothetical protein
LEGQAVEEQPQACGLVFGVEVRRQFAGLHRMRDPCGEWFLQASCRVFGCIGQGGYYGCLRHEG